MILVRPFRLCRRRRPAGCCAARGWRGFLGCRSGRRARIPWADGNSAMNRGWSTGAKRRARHFPSSAPFGQPLRRYSADFRGVSSLLPIDGLAGHDRGMRRPGEGRHFPRLVSHFALCYQMIGPEMRSSLLKSLSMDIGDGGLSEHWMETVHSDDARIARAPWHAVRTRLVRACEMSAGSFLRVAENPAIPLDAPRFREMRAYRSSASMGHDKSASSMAVAPSAGRQFDFGRDGKAFG